MSKKTIKANDLELLIEKIQKDMKREKREGAFNGLPKEYCKFYCDGVADVWYHVKHELLITKRKQA
jgi:hypothetical protein